MGRGGLTDAQWAVLEPLLPVAETGRPAGCRRRLIDGIRWRVRTGAPWRDMPVTYGAWQTVYGCSTAGNAQVSGPACCHGCRRDLMRPD
ncbi:transposase [Microbispora sitophila]|uniref:transposase n=1 Tax=Microbispora sitophila TaxID=2771537 RepID=UPI0038506767